MKAGGDNEKPIQKWELPKKGAWTVCRFKGSLARKRGLVFLRRGVDTLMDTIVLSAQLLWFWPSNFYVLDQTFLIIKTFFIHKPDCYVALTRYLNLHWKTHFQAIGYFRVCKIPVTLQYFMFLRPSHGAHSGETKTNEILQELFTIQL